MSNSIIHKVLDWTEKTTNELDPKTDKHAYCILVSAIACIVLLLER